MGPEQPIIDVTIIRCPKSQHIELIFEAPFPMGSEEFYVALRSFVDTWSENPKHIFRYHDQRFPRPEH